MEHRAPTMEDVAARAGVSRALVSIVFRDLPGASDQTRRRVLAAAEKIGYRPDHRARLLGRKRTGLLGVSFGVRHPFHGDLVEALYAVAADRGFELALSAVTPGRDEATALAALEAYRCEGLVLLGPELPTEELDRVGRRVPTVVLARALSSTRVGVVRTDDAAGAALAVAHLIDRGHTRIVHVDGGRAPGATERRRGYRSAMKRAGLSAQVLPGGLTEERGAAAAASLLTDVLTGSLADGRPADRPSAVTAFNDRCAVGLLDAVRRADVRVPDELALVGYDDDRFSRLSMFDLTTVRQDTAALAAAAVDQVLARLEGARPAEVVVAPELVVRGTS